MFLCNLSARWNRSLEHNVTLLRHSPDLPKPLVTLQRPQPDLFKHKATLQWWRSWLSRTQCNTSPWHLRSLWDVMSISTTLKWPYLFSYPGSSTQVKCSHRIPISRIFTESVCLFFFLLWSRECTVTRVPERQIVGKFVHFTLLQVTQLYAWASGYR